MSKAIWRRRRWPWIVLALVLLLSGPIVWRLRPLNGTERRLVGTWRQDHFGPVSLAPSRRYRSSADGDWSAGPGFITFRQDVPQAGTWKGTALRLKSLLTRNAPDSYPIEFKGPDCFILKQTVHLAEKVSEIRDVYYRRILPGEESGLPSSDDSSEGGRSP